MNFFGDIELASLLELVTSKADSDYSISLRESLANEDFASFEFEGGSSVYVGKSPLTNTHGFGLDLEKHNQKLLDEIESFFKGKGCSSLITIPSVADLKTLSLLNSNSYKPVCFTNVYILNDLNFSTKREAAHKIEIKEVLTDEQKRMWQMIVSNGFSEKNLDAPDEVSLGQSGMERNRLFIGHYDGAPVSASALYIWKDIARIGGMATLVDYRSKGLQTAMINHRVKAAQEAKCKFIFSDTNPGNASQRNLERNGFKLAYTRSLYFKDNIKK